MPTVNVSAIDVTVSVSEATSASAVNSLLISAAQRYCGVLGVTYEPLASCDFLGDSRSGIVDAGLTKVANDRLIKLMVWFDNEWAYVNRMLDVCGYFYQLEVERRTQGGFR